MVLIVRVAKTKDIGSLVRLWHGLVEYHHALPASGAVVSTRRLAPDAEKKWRVWVLKWIRSPNGFVLLAEDDGKAVGYSLNYIKNNIPIYSVKKFGNMGDLFVMSAYRSKGMGSIFRKMAWKWFRKKRMQFVRIAIHPKNQRSKKIYRGWGFEDNHVVMIRKL